MGGVNFGSDHPPYDIRKVGGGGGGGGGQSTSGPIYEKWEGGGGGAIRFRYDTKSGEGGGPIPLFGTKKILYR